MSEDKQPYIVNKDAQPPQFPTHRHQPEFWEGLGRVVATFGFLEDTLGKAIFALTATRQYPEDEIEEEYRKWLPKLEKALMSTLNPLIDTFAKEVRDHPSTTISNLDELLEDLRKAATFRNVFCHGSWPPPDENERSVPVFVNRQKMYFDTPVDLKLLAQMQAFTAELCGEVINVVTHMGYQFPGSNGPGVRIF